MKQTEPLKKPLSDNYRPLIGTTVVDTMGNRGSIQSLHQEGNATVAVLALEDGKKVNADLSLLERDRDSFFMPVLFEDPSDEYTENSQSHARPGPQANRLEHQFHIRSDLQLHKDSEEHEDMRIPISEEKIHVGKRRIDTGKGVQVKKHVVEHEEIVDVPYAEEALTVEHIEIGKLLSEGEIPQARQEGDTYIIPVFEEVYVVEKRIRLKEEVRIVKKSVESKETKKVKLRSEKVTVERFNEEKSRD